MRFMEWLRIDEFTKLSQIDSSGVELEKAGDKRTYKFGQGFTVTMYRNIQRLEDGTYKRIWKIFFEDPDEGMRLTGTSGGGAVGIYRNVLAAIKKLTETEDVDGLVFSGTQSSMDIMYDRFMKTLGGFTVIGRDSSRDKIYLRNDLLGDLSATEQDKAAAAGKEHDDEIEKLKLNKIKTRNLNRS